MAPSLRVTTSPCLTYRICIGCATPLITSRQALLALALIASLGCKSETPLVPVHYSPFGTSVKIDLGALNPKERRGKARVLFHNITNTSITVTDVKTSCPCVELKDLATLAPDQIMAGTIVMDLSSEEDTTFSGSLSVDATGLDQRGEPVFCLTVLAAIVSLPRDVASLGN